MAYSLDANALVKDHPGALPKGDWNSVMMLARTERAVRERAKRVLARWPRVYRYAASKHRSYMLWRQSRETANHDDHSVLEGLRAEIAQERAARVAERQFLASQLGEHQGAVQEHFAAIQTLTAERDALRAERAAIATERDRTQHDLSFARAELAELRAELEPSRTPAEDLIAAIATRKDLTSARIELLAERVETVLSNPSSDAVGIHREIGKALFHRSSQLYSGDGLPSYLRRYTYPPVLSIALSSHCNASCFFCRESDYKGTTVKFDDIFKLESAIRQARTIDLTGWGEPFFYPRFEDVVSHITSLNSTNQLIQVTSNGSFLSERWGKLLSGKVSRLIISINAATPETYRAQMLYKNERFTFERTVANIREFREQLTEEDRKRILLHIVANTGNFHEISAVVRLAKELEIPVVNVGHYICSHQAHLDKTLWNVKDGYNSEIIEAKALGRKLGVTVFGREFNTAEKEVKGAENCMAPFEQFFIEMPGTTAPCCFMGTERVGNVYTDGFEAVWFSDTMNRLRAERFLPPCKVCTIFTPFDNKIAHMSPFLTTKADDIVLGGGPALGTTGKGIVEARKPRAVPATAKSGTSPA
jgi:MoaA/NifB/PqqE/SkfB family radical SAM enzyme